VYDVHDVNDVYDEYGWYDWSGVYDGSDGCMMGVRCV